MKIAIISVTAHGALLGQKIADFWATQQEAEIVQCYEKIGKESIAYEQVTSERKPKKIIFQTLSKIMGDIFTSYDHILCIMATGIVVRLISPYVVHKSSDPAVLVMDEQGKFVISLLSGHLGGANEWTKDVAHISGALPVITTATDVNNLLAPDNLARIYHLGLSDFETLRQVNAAIVAREKVPYYIDKSLFSSEELFAAIQQQGGEVFYFTPEEEKIPLPLDKKNGQTFQYLHTITDSDAQRLKSNKFNILITDKLIETPNCTLFLRPKTMVVGIGCRRDTDRETISAAIKGSLAKLNRSDDSVLTATSVDVKADEIGLLETIKSLHWSIHFYKPEEIEDYLEEKPSFIHESNFVKKTIGVGNVCETTSLIMAQSKILMQKKTIYPRTTVAIAQVQLRLSALDQVMKNL